MRLQGALLAAALFAGASYLQAASETAESFYMRGLKLERARSYDAAASFYAAAIAKDPQYAPALKELGNCHYYLGDKAQAYKDYQGYLLLRPDDKVIAALSAKLAPPVTTAGKTSNVDDFFQEPGWKAGVPEDAVKAQGRIPVPLVKAVEAVSGIFRDLGQGLVSSVSSTGEVHSTPFLINIGALNGSPGTSSYNMTYRGGDPRLFQNRRDFLGNKSAYSLQAVFEDHQTYVRVRWKLYMIINAADVTESEHIVSGEMSPPSAQSDVMLPPPQEATAPAPGAEGVEASDGGLVQHNQEILEAGKKRFATWGLPGAPQMLDAEINEKMQKDWNWRLWQRLQAESVGIEVKGWPAPAGTIAGFNLYLGEIPDGAWKKVNAKPITGRSYRIENLVVGKTYYFYLTNLTVDGVELRPSAPWEQTATADGKGTAAKNPDTSGFQEDPQPGPAPEN